MEKFKSANFNNKFMKKFKDYLETVRKGNRVLNELEPSFIKDESRINYADKNKTKQVAERMRRLHYEAVPNQPLL
jgi:hypothetical protein